MKKIKLFILGVFFLTNLLAQSPLKLSYQAIIRDNDNKLITNKQIGLKITILEGSPEGISVYSELKEPFSNSNGLISIEIGSNNDFSSIDWSGATFYIKSEIDLDISDGTNNYSIIAVSRLLSVPYALYAENVNTEDFAQQKILEDTAIAIRNDIPDYDNNLQTFDDLENASSQLRSEIPSFIGFITKDVLNDSFTAIREEINDMDKLATLAELNEAKSQLRSEIPGTENFITKNILNDSTAAIREDINDMSDLATSTDLEDVKSQLRSEIPDVSNLASQDALEDTAASIRGDLSLVDGTETFISKGESIEITGSGTNNAPYEVSTDFTEQHYIGELYGGGIIFILDDTKKHGVIVSLIDLSTNSNWGNNDSTDAISPWNGFSNTNAIVNSGQSSDVAALQAYYYSSGGYSDWYLPSFDELNILYNVRYQTNKTLSNTSGAEEITQDYYWSSSEISAIRAWALRFDEGRGSIESKGSHYKVRAVRKF